VPEKPYLYLVVGVILSLIIGGLIGYYVAYETAPSTVTTVVKTITTGAPAKTVTVTTSVAITKTVERVITTTVPTVQPPKVIRIFTSPEMVSYWREAFEKAKEKWPEIAEFELKIETPPDPKTAFITAFEAGDAPQIILVDSFEVPAFVEAGYLYPLTEWLVTWPDYFAFPKSMIDMVSWRGGVYALPFQTDVRVIWTRKDILKEKGIGWPYQAMSLDELIEVSRKLKKLGVKYPLCLESGTNWGEGTTMQAFLPLLWALGGKLYDWSTGKWVVTSEAHLKVLEFYYTIYKEGLANPDVPKVARPWEICLSAFQKGETVFYFDGNWALGAFRTGGDYEIPNWEERVGWMKIPGLPGKFGSASGGWTYAIAMKGRGIPPDWKDVVWKIYSMFYSPEIMAKYCIERPWLPPRVDVAEREDYKKELPLFVEMARELLPITRYRPALPEYPKISLEIQKMVEEVATLKKTPLEALKEFALRVRDIVGSDKIIDELGLLSKG